MSHKKKKLVRNQSWLRDVFFGMANSEFKSLVFGVKNQKKNPEREALSPVIKKKFDFVS